MMALLLAAPPCSSEISPLSPPLYTPLNNPPLFLFTFLLSTPLLGFLLYFTPLLSFSHLCTPPLPPILSFPLLLSPLYNCTLLLSTSHFSSSSPPPNISPLLFTPRQSSAPFFCPPFPLLLFSSFLSSSLRLSSLLLYTLALNLSSSLHPSITPLYTPPLILVTCLLFSPPLYLPPLLFLHFSSLLLYSFGLHLYPIIFSPPLSSFSPSYPPLYISPLYSYISPLIPRLLFTCPFSSSLHPSITPLHTPPLVLVTSLLFPPPLYLPPLLFLYLSSTHLLFSFPLSSLLYPSSLSSFSPLLLTSLFISSLHLACPLHSPSPLIITPLLFLLHLYPPPLFIPPLHFTSLLLLFRSMLCSSLNISSSHLYTPSLLFLHPSSVLCIYPLLLSSFPLSSFLPPSCSPLYVSPLLLFTSHISSFYICTLLLFTSLLSFSPCLVSFLCLSSLSLLFSSRLISSPLLFSSPIPHFFPSLTSVLSRLHLLTTFLLSSSSPFHYNQYKSKPYFFLPTQTPSPEIRVILILRANLLSSPLCRSSNKRGAFYRGAPRHLN